MTIGSPHSEGIILDFEALPTDGAVQADLAAHNPKLGDIVTIRVSGVEVTSAVVIEGEADNPVGLRLTDSLAEE